MVRYELFTVLGELLMVPPSPAQQKQPGTTDANRVELMQSGNRKGRGNSLDKSRKRKETQCPVQNLKIAARSIADRLCCFQQRVWELC